MNRTIAFAGEKPLIVVAMVTFPAAGMPDPWSFVVTVTGDGLPDPSLLSRAKQFITLSDKTGSYRVRGFVTDIVLKPSASTRDGLVDLHVKCEGAFKTRRGE